MRGDDGLTMLFISCGIAISSVASPALVSAPTIPIRSSFSVLTELRRISCRFLTMMLVLPLVPLILRICC